MRCLVLLFFFFSVASTDVYKPYVEKIYHAFFLQMIGKSRLAHYEFKDAYIAALEAGEPFYKVHAVDQLFFWYRGVGHTVHLSSFSATEPFQMSSSNNEIPTPDQSLYKRQFMIGIAEILSGIFCVSVGSVPIKILGGSALWEGIHDILDSCNHIWHESEKKQYMSEFKQLESDLLKAAEPKK